jgi:hypothetical protein
VADPEGVAGRPAPPLFRVRAALRRLAVGLEADEPRPGLVRLDGGWFEGFYDAAALADALDGLTQVNRKGDSFHLGGGFWARIAHAMRRPS